VFFAFLFTSNGFLGPSFRADVKKVKNFADPLVFACKGGFPMRASDSSVKGAVDHFHTTRWAAVMVSADGPSQSVSLALCDVLVAAEGGLSP